VQRQINKAHEPEPLAQRPEKLEINSRGQSPSESPPPKANSPFVTVEKSCCPAIGIPFPRIGDQP